MTNLDFFKNKDRENFGHYFIEKALNFALEKEFGKSFEFIIEGLNFLTCDCQIREALDTIESKEDLFNDIENSTSNQTEYLFTKAYFMSFGKTKKELILAFEAIKKYQEFGGKDFEYGQYIKGDILAALNYPNEALDCYLESDMRAISFSSARINFKIGKISERFIDSNGLCELYASFIENPSSSCCAEALRKSTTYHDLKLKIEDNASNNNLLKLFIKKVDDKEDKNFITEYRNLINEISENNIQIVQDFIDTLKSNHKLFIYGKEDEFYGDDDVEEEDENDWNNFSSYRDYFDAMTDGLYGDYEESDF